MLNCENDCFVRMDNNEKQIIESGKPIEMMIEEMAYIERTNGNAKQHSSFSWIPRVIA